MSQIKPRVERVPIYQGDDIEQLTKLDERVDATATDLAAAEHRLKVARQAAILQNKNAPARLMHEDQPDPDQASDVITAQADVDTARGVHDIAAAERDDFATGAEERGVLVVLIARPRLRWRELMREHPPRDEEDVDKPFNCNMDTLPDALLPESIDREMSTVEGDLTEFLDSLNDYDYYNRLFLTAWALNRGSLPADPTQRLRSSSQT